MSVFFRRTSSSPPPPLPPPSVGPVVASSVSRLRQATSASRSAAVSAVTSMILVARVIAVSRLRRPPLPFPTDTSTPDFFVQYCTTEYYRIVSRAVARTTDSVASAHTPGWLTRCDADIKPGTRKPGQRNLLQGKNRTQCHIRFDIRCHMSPECFM